MQDRRGRKLFTYAEKKSGPKALLVLADNLCSLEIRRQGHMVKQCLGVLEEADCNGPLGEMPGRVDSRA